MGLALGIISIGLIASAPIQGALLGKDQADYVWIKPIAYSGVSVFLGKFVDNFPSIYFFSFLFEFIVPNVRCNNSVWHRQNVDCQTERIAASLKRP